MRGTLSLQHGVDKRAHSGPPSFCKYRSGLIHPASMKHGMRLGDYIDLEWFLSQDRVLSSEDNLERDRALGLSAEAEKVLPHRFSAFWLARRRADHPGVVPSAYLGTFLAVFFVLAATCASVAGASLVRALLLYSGAEPVNVSVFLLLAVAAQAALSLVSAVFVGTRAMTDTPGIPLQSLCVFLGRRIPLSLPQLSFLRHTLGDHGWLGRMLAWRIVQILQTGGVFFAAGALGGTVVSVAVTDLAFGWQSTLQVGARGMHALVAAVAMPWSWMPVSWGLVPSLEQIEGSRIVLKDGIAALANDNLAAWWPFLCMSLLVYGLLPRLTLLAVAWVRLRKLEDGFAHPDLTRIIDRMRAPLIGGYVGFEKASTPLPVDQESGIDVGTTADDRGDGTREIGCVLVLPPELDGRIERQALDTLAQRAFGYPLGLVVPMEMADAAVRNTLGRVASLNWMGAHERFVILVEAWQPPIRESLAALQILGRAAGRPRSCALVLTGRPQGGDWLTAPTADDTNAWVEALERLAPLRFGVFEGKA